MKMWMTALALAVVCGGCATVSASKQRQVDQVNQTGYYSYERAMSGPPR